MAKNVLVLMGSPRAEGNTRALCEAFLSGAREVGWTGELIPVAERNIHGCLGCALCQGGEGVCVQRDDMDEIYEKLLAADAVVLASPIYFFSWTSQLKAVIDRSVALRTRMKDKRFYLISACALPDEARWQNMLRSFREYLTALDDSVTEGGWVIGAEDYASGRRENSAAMEKARALGRGL